MKRGRPANPNLSDREIQALSIFGNEGNFDHNKTSELLNVAPCTFKTHRTSIMQKLKVNNIFEAFFLAAHKGLLQNKRWEGRI